MSQRKRKGKKEEDKIKLTNIVGLMSGNIKYTHCGLVEQLQLKSLPVLLLVFLQP